MTNTCDTGTCQEGAATQCCSTGCCGGQSCKDEQGSHAQKLLNLADEAFKELLKEKIKQELEKTSGAKLAALGKALAEANLRRHGHEIQGKLACKEVEGQLQSLLVEIVK